MAAENEKREKHQRPGMHREDTAMKIAHEQRYVQEEQNAMREAAITMADVAKERWKQKARDEYDWLRTL